MKKLLLIASLILNGSLIAKEGVGLSSDWSHYKKGHRHKLMEELTKTVVELENKFPLAPYSPSFYSYFQEGLDLIIPMAHAASSKTCFYGGWVSYVRKDGKCQSPWKAKNYAAKRGVKQYQTSCRGKKSASHLFRCNPTFFGPAISKQQLEHFGVKDEGYADYAGRDHNARPEAGICINVKNLKANKGISEACHQVSRKLDRIRRENGIPSWKEGLTNPESIELYEAEVAPVKKVLEKFCRGNPYNDGTCQSLKSRIGLKDAALAASEFSDGVKTTLQLRACGFNQEQADRLNKAKKGCTKQVKNKEADELYKALSSLVAASHCGLLNAEVQINANTQSKEPAPNHCQIKIPGDFKRGSSGRVKLILKNGGIEYFDFNKAKSKKGFITTNYEYRDYDQWLAGSTDQAGLISYLAKESICDATSLLADSERLEAQHEADTKKFDIINKQTQKCRPKNDEGAGNLYDSLRQVYTDKRCQIKKFHTTKEEDGKCLIDIKKTSSKSGLQKVYFVNNANQRKELSLNVSNETSYRSLLSKSSIREACQLPLELSPQLSVRELKENYKKQKKANCGILSTRTDCASAKHKSNKAELAYLEAALSEHSGEKKKVCVGARCANVPNGVRKKQRKINKLKKEIADYNKSISTTLAKNLESQEVESQTVLTAAAVKEKVEAPSLKEKATVAAKSKSKKSVSSIPAPKKNPVRGLSKQEKRELTAKEKVDRLCQNPSSRGAIQNCAKAKAAYKIEIAKSQSQEPIGPKQYIPSPRSKPNSGPAVKRKRIPSSLSTSDKIELERDLEALNKENSALCKRGARTGRGRDWLNKSNACLKSVVGVNTIKLRLAESERLEYQKRADEICKKTGRGSRSNCDWAIAARNKAQEREDKARIVFDKSRKSYADKTGHQVP